MTQKKEHIEELISCLRDQPALWQTKNENYKNRNLRNDAWEALLKSYLEVDDSATLEGVKKKINTLRACYRRELQKIKRSEKSGAGIEDIYIPNLWYFEHLDFLKDQESNSEGINTLDNGPEIETPKPKKRKHDDSDEFLQKAVEHLDRASKKNARDDADVFAEGWAIIYRQLSSDQKIFAKKGIDELLLQGQLGRLTYESVRNIDVFDNQSSHAMPLHHIPIHAQRNQRFFRCPTPFSSSSSGFSVASHQSSNEVHILPDDPIGPNSFQIVSNVDISAPNSFEDLFNSAEYK